MTATGPQSYSAQSLSIGLGSHVSDQAPAVVSSNSHSTATPTSEARVSGRLERFRSTNELRDWLLQSAKQQWGYLFGKSEIWPYYYGIPYPQVQTFNDLAIPRVFNVALDTNAAVASSTNVQVAGVDEADIVETDGSYLYILSGRELVIVDVRTGHDPKISSRIALSETPTGMYLSGSRLAIVSTSPAYAWGRDFRMFPVLGL